MSTPLITLMGKSHLFMRSTAGILLITFSMMILQPVIAAAQVSGTAMATAVPDKSAETQMSQTLEKIENKLTGLENKLQNRQDADAERNELKQLKSTLKHLDASVRANLVQIEQQIHDHHLPKVILERHQAMGANYSEKLQALTDELDGVEIASEVAGRLNHIRNAKGQLNANQKKRSQLPFDPSNLPFKASENKSRPPKETKEELEQIIAQNAPVQFAALELNSGMLAMSVSASITPVAADLAENEEVQITEDIKALAAQLNHQPVAIYNWVRNNTDYIPTYGSLQGSQVTLVNKRGNAYDTASLLIALLRASNIPARYAYGTVQIPIEKVMNWVGGVKTPLAALDLMGQGGIPNIALTQGGVIKYGKLEHIWVEAWIDYYPSRGAKNKTGDRWVPLDASFKQYDYSQGMDINNNVPFDTVLLDQVLQSAQINSTEGSITNIDQNQIKTLVDAYQTQVDAHIKATKSDSTVGDVIGNKIIPSQDNPILASGLPYQMLQTAGNFAEMTDTLRHQIKFQFYASATDQSLGNPAFSYTTSLAKLGAQRISFAYEPSTDADKAVMDTAFEGYQIRFPAYLVKMTPVIKIESQRVAGSGAYTVGTDQIFTVEVKTPWYTESRNYQVTSGDVWVLGVNAAGMTPQAFEKRIQTHNLSAGDRSDFTEEMYHQIMLGYWGELNAFEDVIAAATDIRYNQLPAHGFAGSPVSVIYNFGIPRWASYKSRILDVKENQMTAVHIRNENGQTANYLRKTGLMGSYLESGIYDQAFLMEPGYSMSAVTALAKANEHGIPIYHITDANLQVALTKLTVDADIKNDIINAVNAGLEVTVSRDPIQVADFTGAGYIITDPVTGSGSYRISGGREGNNSSAPQAVYPLPQMPATPIFGLMMRSALRTAGASLVTEGGVIIGIVAAPEIATLGALLSLLFVMMTIMQSVSQETIDLHYPRLNEPERLRHYTRKSNIPFIINGILGNGILYASDSTGDFGEGVYFVDPTELVKDTAGVPNLFGVNLSVKCPPTTEQKDEIAKIYNIPGRNQPTDGTSLTGYIELVLVRENYFKIKRPINDKNAIEIIIEAPLVSLPKSTAASGKALIIDGWNLRIDQASSCY